ncbi:MAG: hypothetical protein ACP5K8_08325 [Nitrososphaeria archaeon]
MKVKPFSAGILFGLIFAFSQAFLGYVWKDAYAYCTIGHPRDLMVWLTNVFTDSKISEYVLPLLSTFGVILGSFIASKVYKEFHIVKIEKSDLFTMFILGFAAAIFGLFATFCPIRLLVLLSFGDLEVLFGIIGYTLGIILAIKLMRR